MPAASNVDATAAMYWKGDALEYYLNPRRGRVPRWGGRFAVMAWKKWLEFDPISLAGRARAPVRIVTSEGGATPGGAKRFAAGLQPPHDVVWTKETQIDFYDDPATVAFAAERAVEHLGRTPGMNAELEQIRSTVVRVTHHTDRKDWGALRALYADDVETDYTSLFGGTVQRQPADDVIVGWRKALDAVSTQHLLGPIDVEVRGSSAVAQCHVRAWHHARGAPGGEEWVVGGHYVFGLVRAGETWKITRMKLETLQQSGNLELLHEAQAAR